MRTEDQDALAVLRGFRGGRPLTFGAMLRALRQCDAVPLAAWAAQLGITRQHLSDIERGRRAVSVERAAAWARTLGYPAGPFITLALQAQVDAAALPFAVTLAPRPRRARRAA